MRFPKLSRLAGLTRTQFSCATLTVAGVFLGGCDGLTPGSFNPNKGFIDPSEVAVMDNVKRGQSLIVPIVEKLDPAAEETDLSYSQATEVTAADMMASATDYTIGRSDLLQISITDLVAPGVETIKASRVSESGNVSMPLIGQVACEGLTEAQLETKIAQAYKDAQIIANAQVSVQVLEARARTFSVMGAVQSAGQYSIIKNDFRLLDALVAARDLTVNTDLRGNRGIDYIFIIRKISEDQKVAGESGSMPMTPIIPPATKPNTDVLTPRTDAGSKSKRVALLMDDPATAPSGAAPDAAAQPMTPPENLEGRYVIIDGKPVLVTGADPTTAPSTDMGATPTPAPEAAPASNGFEFNQLAEPTDRRIIRVPLSMLRAGELKYNIVVRPDDIIIVRPPVEGEYYMGGHVARVGVYSLTARKITLKQAVISAGMLDAIGVPGRCTIVRRLPSSDREIFARVDLEKIFAGEEPDVYLKPDDQVMVGTNAVMPFIAAVRGGFRTTYGFGFLYDRNYAADENNR